MGTIQLFFSLRVEGNQKQFQLSASLEMMKRVTENCLIDILFTDAENGHLLARTSSSPNPAVQVYKELFLTKETLRKSDPHFKTSCWEL